MRGLLGVKLGSRRSQPARLLHPPITDFVGQIGQVRKVPTTDVNVGLAMGAEGLISKASIADSDRMSPDKFGIQQFIADPIYSSEPRNISEATLK
jgi:hypothetical protein